jgi:hypothetical protein
MGIEELAAKIREPCSTANTKSRHGFKIRGGNGRTERRGSEQRSEESKLKSLEQR